MLDGKFRQFLNLVIYQVYPRSFLDTDGDGIGNLNGVTRKLDYLHDLGVNAIWLCPCYQSPNDDNGYDISDYRDIMTEFGTMDDMKELIARMHERDMKLIMDLVPNHTSTLHQWFQESRKGRNNPFSDFYYWSDSIPNDWQSAFGGCAWEFDELRGQYYLHSYAIRQADLNWTNPAVVRAMQDVVDFWVDLGVDGFRIDVIDQISKDFEKNENCFGPHLHEYIRALFGREKTKHLFTVGECWVSDIEEMKRHCAAERNELSTLFQFDHMECGRKDKFTPGKDSLRSLRDILISWQNRTESNDLLYSLFLGNHDQPPMISRLANDTDLRYESATCMAAMTYLLKGIPFIYQGQEYGSVSAHYDSIDSFNDVESINAYQEFLKDHSPAEAIEKVNFGSRDNARHPFCWRRDGGFSDGKPWIVPHSRQWEINLENDLLSDRSVFRFYQELLKLRKSTPAFIEGDFRVLSEHEDDCFIFSRSLGKDQWYVICNFEAKQSIKLPEDCGEPVLSNFRAGNTALFLPYQCAVYHSQSV